MDNLIIVEACDGAIFVMDAANNDRTIAVFPNSNPHRHFHAHLLVNAPHLLELSRCALATSHLYSEALRNTRYGTDERDRAIIRTIAIEAEVRSLLREFEAMPK